jgi:membrane protein DedA with SNARE-associated domain
MLYNPMGLFLYAATSMESFGYFAVFFLIVLGSLGLPLPEESILLLSGYLASTGFFKILYVIAFGLVGTVVGDNMAYWLARKKGLDFMLRYGEIFLVQKKHLKKAEDFFKRHGGKAVFFSRFILGFRFFGPVLAGVSKMRWSRFQIYNLIAAIIWIPFISFLGYLLGTNVVAIMANITNIGHILFAVILIAVSLFLIRELVRE